MQGVHQINLWILVMCQTLKSTLCQADNSRTEPLLKKAGNCQMSNSEPSGLGRVSYCRKIA